MPPLPVAIWNDTTYSYEVNENNDDRMYASVILVYDTHALDGCIQHTLVMSLFFFITILVLVRLYEYTRGPNVVAEVDSSKTTVVSVKSPGPPPVVSEFQM